MRAIFIGGPLDRRVEEVSNPAPMKMYAADLGATDFSLHYAHEHVEIRIRQVEYERTLASDGYPVYVMKRVLEADDRS